MSRAKPMDPARRLLTYWRQLGLRKGTIGRLSPRQRRRYRHATRRALGEDPSK